MKRHKPAPGQQEFIDEIRAKQRNTIWPDTLRNSIGVNKFLWQGLPNAPLVQRVGAWIIGLTYLMIGVTFIGIGMTEGSRLYAYFGLGFILLGAKVCSNGFRRHGKESNSKGTGKSV